MQQLSGRTAFITGGAQGIGKSIARALAKEGCRIALVDRDVSEARSAAADLAELAEVRAYELDVQDRSKYARVANQVEDELGLVSILCNNAGVSFPETVEGMSYELWDFALGVNLGGVVNGVQTFLPRMLQRAAPAHIVNTGSVAGLAGVSSYMYTTSKFGVVGLSEALRNDLEAAGHPVGVTVLCPGAVATGIAARTSRVLATMRGGEEFRQAQADIEQNAGALQEILDTHGTEVDAVGGYVAEAIKANRLYAFTDDSGRALVTERARSIVEAMPQSSS